MAMLLKCNFYENLSIMNLEFKKLSLLKCLTLNKNFSCIKTMCSEI